MSVCPSGWVYHAVRAPGSKVTALPAVRAGAFAANNGSIRTMPVNHSPGPFDEGCEPLDVMFMVALSFIVGLSGATPSAPRELLVDLHGGAIDLPQIVRRQLDFHGSDVFLKSVSFVVLGIGAIHGLCASGHPSAICAGVALLCAPMRLTRLEGSARPLSLAPAASSHHTRSPNHHATGQVIHASISAMVHLASTTGNSTKAGSHSPPPSTVR